ncbi:LamG domain-containing protein [Streptomyces sp. MI02-7b]|uniref:LamG domain-containing protein n=1 Tax=Streptomyces sp. MI02-7b TaxID=462941 RepID=UPI0029A7AA5E|nr:LamG domain-containing protein [Streptomyces sp. MI02-7b]MDX3075892.1 LamG domain-containing protein [Streptomyces sp. MI02-7b]
MSALLAPVPVLGLSAGAEAAAPKTPAASAESREAAASGERVEVVGERTEYSTTYANPDGFTRTLEQSAVPVRVARPDGSWAVPDPTLERRSDGSISPKAAVTGIELSPGGDDDPLVTLAKGKESLSLGWPGALPEPVLDGVSATYPEVLPGVDLRMTATVEGVRQVLIVKSAQAAANPDLKKIEFSLTTDGLTVQSRAGGGLEASDADGNTVFRSPAAMMWDSSGDTATPALNRAAADGSAAAAGGDGESSPDQAAGPSDGDASAIVPVSVDQDTVSVQPDTDLLGGEDTTFPLYIDPDTSWSESERTVLSSDGDAFYNFDGGDDGMGVGLCGTYVTGGVSYYCGSGYKNRMYFEFAPSQLAGKQVLDATFRVTERWSMSCTKSVVDLVRTANISSATRWPGPTANWDVMGDRTVSAGRGTACDPDQPDAPIEFNDDPTQNYENLTATVKSFADGNISRLTLMLKAHDEADPNGWKRFDDDAVLSVNYVGKPAAPTSAGLVHGDGVICAPANAPDIIADPTPTMSARPQTVAGGEHDAHLRARFYLQKQSGSTWVDVPSGNPVYPSSGYVGDNNVVQYPTPVALTDGATYRLGVYTRSYYEGGVLEARSTSASQFPCYFKIDSTAPKGVNITWGSPYKECTANDCAATGGPGQKAQFTFAPLTEDKGTVTGYTYRLSDKDPWSQMIPGETVHPWITPTRPGEVILAVMVYDINGSSTEVDTRFKVAEGQGAIGRWHFDDSLTQPGATAAADSATEGTRHPATLSAAGAGWSPLGRRGSADGSLGLTGSGYAATSQWVINTSSSFTLSAWAYLEESSKFQTIVSQTGSDSSGFSLYYSPTTKKYTVRWSWTDASGVRQFIAQPATANASLKVWSQVAATYDADAKTIQLFVNGIPQGAPKQVPSGGEKQRSDAPLQFGRASYVYGTFTDYWQGTVDEVAVWQRKLENDEVATESSLLEPDGTADLELVANWDPAGASGTTLADKSTGYGRSLTLAGGATLDGEAMVLPGKTGDAATTGGPIVDESGSFTVTTGVELDPAAVAAMDDGEVAQVAGQQGADGGASWGVWIEKQSGEFDPDTETSYPQVKWRFGQMTADGIWNVAVSNDWATVTANSITQVTGVFDAYSRSLTLYVGVNRSGTDAVVDTVSTSSGEFAVGKPFANPPAVNWLTARITDVRIWAGAAQSREQVGDITGATGA